MGFEHQSPYLYPDPYELAHAMLGHPTGLYCKLSIGRFDGEHEQEAISQTLDDLPAELYNKLWEIVQGSKSNLAELLRETAGHINDH